MTVFISLDVEASGPVAGLYNLVSIGASAVRKTEGAWTIDPDDFYVELKPCFEGFSDEAMAIHGITREHLEKNGTEAKEAMQRLRDWSLAKLGAESGRPVFVGHNALFDWGYVNYYFVHTDVKNPYGYDGLDTKSLAMGALNIPWKDCRKQVLQKLLKLPEHDDDQAHRADYDARYQAEILRGLLTKLDERKKGG